MLGAVQYRLESAHWNRNRHATWIAKFVATNAVSLSLSFVREVFDVSELRIVSARLL
jgi:hypothetical protein